MVKKINWEPGRTFNEFSLLTDLTTEECSLANVSLETSLSDNLKLKIPFLSAAMTSVTGKKMALALGKAGGIGILPVKYSTEKQAEIVSNIKNKDLTFVEDPICVRETETIEEVIRKIEKHGYSTIPVVNKFRQLLGVFTQEHYWKLNVNSDEKVTKAMKPLNELDEKISFNPEITVEEIKNQLKETQEKYIVVLDNEKRLVKMAFKQDLEDIKVGVAVSTYPGWEERVEKNIQAGVDLIVIDTSDAYSEFAKNIIKEYKNKGYGVPICAGNVITYEGTKYLMESGADVIKVGMSSGSICTTQREKATGRAPMTALLEVNKARENYQKETGRYIPIVVDGGVTSPADMIIALTTADAIMMGGYFNKFYEAAGPKLDKNNLSTTDETKMEYVEKWGEGSEKARNLGRYGHNTKKTFFPEGVEGTIPYEGRLKPNLEKDLTKIKSALSHAGSEDLREFRKKSVLELNSPSTSQIVSNPHNINVKG